MQSNVSMFADDHQFNEIDKYVSTIQTTLQDSAQKATSWYESNSLKGNYGKYGSMLMSRINKLKDHKLKLNVNGTDIKSYDSITLLGVDIRDLKIPGFWSTGKGKLPVAVHMISGGKFNLSYPVLSLELNIAGLELSFFLSVSVRFFLEFA